MEAEAECHTATTLNQQPARDYPDVTDYRPRAALSIMKLSAFQERRGRPAVAVTSIRRAIVYLEALLTRSATDIYNLAGCQSLLSGLATHPGSGLSEADGRARADRAIVSLPHALDDGFNDCELIRVDTDLDPLRGREDFRLLLLDLAMPADPFAAAR
jgi:hypothetical protein